MTSNSSSWTTCKGLSVTLVYRTYSHFWNLQNRAICPFLPQTKHDLLNWSCKGGPWFLLLFLFRFPLPWGLLLSLKTLFLGFNWLLLGKWFLGILLLAEIRFTFVVELPLLLCHKCTCPLASSTTRKHVIKVSKDVLSFFGTPLLLYLMMMHKNC